MPNGEWILNEPPEDSTPPSSGDALSQQEPDGLIAIMLQLRWVWAVATVGRALVAQCPTLDDLDALCASPELHILVTRLAPVIRAVRGDLANVTTLEAVADVGATHHADGLAAMTTLAETLGVPPHTLLTVLMHA